MKFNISVFLFMACALQAVACAGLAGTIADSDLAQVHACEGIDQASRKEKIEVKGNEESSLLQVNIGAHLQAGYTPGGWNQPRPCKDLVEAQKVAKMMEEGISVDNCDCIGCATFAHSEDRLESFDHIKYGMDNAKKLCVDTCLANAFCKRVLLRADGCHLYGSPATSLFSRGDNDQKEYCWAQPGCEKHYGSLCSTNGFISHLPKMCRSAKEACEAALAHECLIDKNSEYCRRMC